MSDANCRSLVEEIIRTKNQFDIDKTVKKPELICHFKRLVMSLAEDPKALWSTLNRIAPPRKPTDIHLGRGYDGGDYSDSPGGGPTCLSLNDVTENIKDVQATSHEASNCMGANEDEGTKKLKKKKDNHHTKTNLHYMNRVARNSDKPESENICPA